ncbi:SpoIIE family protein phosphatase [Paractinoplanes ferrugineus]|uniref:Histidine kinase n=1 Tax=Paractinoplanes ferrugineus TaxID=113564 RepID=A0A919MPL7_9ACTN|nr:SpoIIE family protein phosphatase [Actinoplanes ferrugineus]GIE15437.1 histidine kinase [Actinoplanes ferrugineus]
MNEPLPRLDAPGGTERRVPESRVPESRVPESRVPEHVTAFPAMLEDNIDDLYDSAPCGNVSTLLDGTIAKINATLLVWLGYTRDEVVGRKRFSDLLTVGGRLYHETHFAPLLQMHGEVNGVALELKRADGGRLPVLVTSVVKTGSDGQPMLIRSTIFDARERRAYEQELLHARRAADAERERLRGLIGGLQRSLLPDVVPTPPGMQSSAYYHMASADRIGGDFYDLFPLPSGRWGFFLGDVCGKGLAAAATTAAARHTLRTALAFNPDPAAALTYLNNVLYQDHDSPSHRHCTVILGTLTPAPGGCSITIAGGGHPAPMLLRTGGTLEPQPTTGGTIIGILPAPRIATRTFDMTPGDTLILYSDGLLEAHAGDRDERYGEEALQDFLVRLAPTSAAAAVTALTELLATLGRLDDDVALLALSLDDTAPTG